MECLGAFELGCSSVDGVIGAVSLSRMNASNCLGPITMALSSGS
jgi:hypothetical protein